jgi:putative endonuclease
MSQTQSIGSRGEDTAAKYLVNEGHRIIERNWRAGKDEIDLITISGRFLVIVEVKTRTNTFGNAPETSVDERKQKCLMRAAEAYIHENNIEMELRFDIVSVIISSKETTVFHIPDAFYSTLA